MALDLVLAALKFSYHNICEMIRKVNKNLRDYYKAYKSYCKKKKEELKNIDIDCTAPG